MNKGIFNNEINKEAFILHSLSNNNNNLYYKVPQPVATEKIDNENKAIDYKKISLTLTGEISSAYIHRNNLTQKSNNRFVENTEDDDEDFLLNIKKNIDKNYRMQNKENRNIRNLQSKSYLSRKKKSAFSDEDQNLMKRFKKCVDEQKSLCITTDLPTETLQRSKNIIPINDNNYSVIPNTLQITPTINNINMNLRNNTNQSFFQIAPRMQGNKQLFTSKNAKTVTETEIEEIVYYKLQCFTPPQKNE